MPSMDLIQTFPYQIRQNVPLQVAHVPDRDWVVSGGDDGFVRIFDCRTGQFLERLDHGSCKCLRSVTLYISDGSGCSWGVSTNSRRKYEHVA
jgi:WD40 repeat protein